VRACVRARAVYIIIKVQQGRDILPVINGPIIENHQNWSARARTRTNAHTPLTPVRPTTSTYVCIYIAKHETKDCDWHAIVTLLHCVALQYSLFKLVFEYNCW